MPSIQVGATNAARIAFSPITAALGDLVSGAGTIAILWKPGTTASGDGCALTNAGASVFNHSISIDTNVWADDDTARWIHAPATYGPANTTDWYITVLDWPSGTAQTERFHEVNLTASSAWRHVDGVIDNATPGAAVGTAGVFRVGYSGDNPLPSGMQIALVAVWNVRLTDANVAALSANKKTSDWYNNAAGQPIFLWQAASDSISAPANSQLIAGHTYSSGDSNLTGLTIGGDPAGGWTFDGTSGGASAVNMTSTLAGVGSLTPNLTVTTQGGVTVDDIEYRLGGGATNTDPNASLSGAMSTAAGGLITGGAQNNLWDNVSSAEALSGDYEYRLLYVKNNHASATWNSPKIWIDSAPAQGDYAIALDSAAIGSTAASSCANENTAPTGGGAPYTFTSPTTKTAGISLGGDLGPGQYKAIWVRRHINASTPGQSDAESIRTEST